jgi:hypothetical protein
MVYENDWLTDFVITQDDLNRLEEWLSEENRGVTLEELTRRIIRGRLRFGRDESPSAFPEWVQEKHVLSWDEEEKWGVGSRVFVLHSTWEKYGKSRQISPMFGIITDLIVDETKRFEKFVIEFENGDQIDYGRVKPGSLEAENRYTQLHQIVWEKEQAAQNAMDSALLDQKIELIFIAKGAFIASSIFGSMKQDSRFETWNERWYLKVWIHNISTDILHRIHRLLLKTHKKATLSQIRNHNTGLPDGEIGDFSLAKSLIREPDLFQPVEGGWQAVPPPPPSWEKAIGAYYVYDPKTYEIILKPGDRLKKNVADRLIELGYYAGVVETES